MKEVLFQMNLKFRNYYLIQWFHVEMFFFSDDGSGTVENLRKSVNRSRTYDLPIIKYDALPCIERMKTRGSTAIEQWFKW